MNLIIFSGIAGVVMMLCGLIIQQKRTLTYIASGLLLALFLLNFFELNGVLPVINFPVEDMLYPTRFGLLMNGIMLFATLMYFFVSARQIELVGNHVAEYYALLFFIFCGVGISTSYTNLLTLFLGIEIISIPLYILTASDKRNLNGIEAALKYFLMGSFSTGIMLMGIAMVYGGTGSFMISKMNFNDSGVSYPLITGVLLLVMSMAFKVSAAPFHFWAPDVYDGAPTVFTSFMATIVKVAAFVAFINLFADATGVFPHQKWKLVIAIIIALTLLIGNITAVFQQSVKRMLAYSSVSQAGFMMFALFSYNGIAKEGIILYAAAYSFATIGLFAVLMKMEDNTFEGFNGLARREPVVAAMVAIFVLSLAGIPFTAGFFGKYFMIASAIAATSGKFLWLVILAMLCAAVSVFYYFRVIQAMYFKAPAGEMVTPAEPITSLFRFGLIALAFFIILIGIMPQILLQYLYF
jgi:NADH-quinone oxidoreductase subunit N